MCALFYHLHGKVLYSGPPSYKAASGEWKIWPKNCSINLFTSRPYAQFVLENCGLMREVVSDDGGHIKLYHIVMYHWLKRKIGNTMSFFVPVKQVTKI